MTRQSNLRMRVLLSSQLLVGLAVLANSLHHSKSLTVLLAVVLLAQPTIVIAYLSYNDAREKFLLWPAVASLSLFWFALGAGAVTKIATGQLPPDGVPGVIVNTTATVPLIYVYAYIFAKTRSSKSHPGGAWLKAKPRGQDIKAALLYCSALPPALAIDYTLGLSVFGIAQPLSWISVAITAIGVFRDPLAIFAKKQRSVPI